MRSKLWCIKIIFCLLKWLRLWTLSKNSMPGESQSLFRLGYTDLPNNSHSREENTIIWIPGSLSNADSSNVTLVIAPESASWFTSQKTFSIREMETCCSKIQSVFIPSKVIEILPLTDSFDRSGFEKFRWVVFDFLLALRSCSKPAYQLLTSSCSY